MQTTRLIAIVLSLSLLAPSALALAGLPCAMSAARVDADADAGVAESAPEVKAEPVAPCHGQLAAAAAESLVADDSTATSAALVDPEYGDGCCNDCSRICTSSSIAAAVAAIAERAERTALVAASLLAGSASLAFDPLLRPPIRSAA